ncbi:MAG: DUF1987 domain-containing protein [Magnetococcales bacterium]|nr:DUF1987 domain-containing protein [Magnetococcales bacterium]NGZ05787.1 DUF1987 domain-containing protein [Magnetococcales bacterium]
METIRIHATDRSPEIEFHFAENRFLISGESYPEDGPLFFTPLLASLATHVQQMSAGSLTFDLRLIYYNSVTARFLVQLFSLLDSSAKRGVQVQIYWHYASDDDNMQEMGEEFGEELEAATFHMCPEEP